MDLPISVQLDSQSTTRRAYADMSARNLQANARTLQAFVGAVKIVAMVKANGFGHGIRSCALYLAKHVYAFGVAHVDEAQILRKVGIKNPIVLMEGVYNQQELLLAHALECITVVHNQRQIAWLDALADGQSMSVWLKIDTGMGRLGCDIAVLADLYQAVQAHPRVEQTPVLMSHLACASSVDHALNTQQLALFAKLQVQYGLPASICNSAAIFNFTQHHYDYVRPGLALYGVSPTALAAADYSLSPVMTLRSQVIAIKDFYTGQSIGYDAKFICSKPMRIAIVAIGYGDGYPRDISDAAVVLINGHLCPIVGAVSMDMMSVDVSHCPGVTYGDMVTLWGEGLPVEQVAKFSKRSCYELLTSVQHRVNFVWSDE